jgi:hypothetical protein
MLYPLSYGGRCNAAQPTESPYVKEDQGGEVPPHPPLAL